MSELLTLKQAAVELKLSPTTLRIQALNGALEAKRLGRDWVVTREALEVYRRDRLRK